MAGYYSEVIKDSPIGYWRLGEAAGTTARNERGSAGTYSGGVVLRTSGAETSDSDTAALFDGSTGRVSLGSFAAPKTIEAWARFTTSNQRVIWSNRLGGPSDQIYFGISVGKFFVFRNTGTPSSFTVGPAINDGNWHHLVYAQDGVTAWLYVDGALVSSAAQTSTGNGSLTTPCYIAFDQPNNEWFPGAIDEVSIYDRVLSAARVAAHYAARDTPALSGIANVAHEWEIEARENATLSRIGLIEDYQQATIIPRFNAVGAWSLDLDADSAAAKLLNSYARGIVVSLDGVEIFSGPVGKRSRSRDATANRLTLSGPDDSTWLARRLCYPEAPALTTATNAYDVRTGVASTVMRAYVDANAGPSANVDRKVSGLSIGVDPLIGPTVTGRGRFQSLQDILNELALAGGDLGYEVVQMGTALAFSVYRPVDRSATAVFSFEFGNLRGFQYEDRASDGNYVITGGGGDGIARAFSTGSDAPSVAAYGRIEIFDDRRDTTDATELAQNISKTLDEHASQNSVSLQPVDTGGLAFSSGYGLGDKVTAVVDDVRLVDVVREVQITMDKDGVVVNPVVGTPRQRDPNVPNFFTRLSNLEARLIDLERRK